MLRKKISSLLLVLALGIVATGCLNLGKEEVPLDDEGLINLRIDSFLSALKAANEEKILAHLADDFVFETTLGEYDRAEFTAGWIQAAEVGQKLTSAAFYVRDFVTTEDGYEALGTFWHKAVFGPGRPEESFTTESRMEWVKREGNWYLRRWVWQRFA